MSTPRRSAPTGTSADDDNWKPENPNKKSDEDPVAAEQRILEEMRPPTRTRR